MAERFEGVTYRTAISVIGGFLALFLTRVSPALAYPTVDPSNQDTLPTGAPPGTELPETDINGLQNQLRLTNPAAVPNANAWTIIPRVTLQEMFTDNVLEAQTPRRADAITVISPGISAVADTARLKLNLDYQPDLLLHAIDGPLNAITQHLTATGLVTIVPDLAFVDLRALSGVQSVGGALSSAGNLGSSFTGPQYATPGQTGVNPRDEVQTSSVGISPYLLRQFKDYGTGKLGVSLDASNYSSITGFAANPFSTGGGINGQSLLATEQVAQFTTGEFLGRVQSAFSADFLQSRTQAQTGATVPVITAAGTVGTAPLNSFTSQRQTIMDTVTYQMNRNLALIGALGEQQIHYSNAVGPEVNGLTWKAGFTVTPSEESAATLTYGRFNGVDAFQANGHLQLTARTLFSFDYSNTVGTQLESLQNELNNSTVVNGQLINAQTGGPNFIATNTLGVQSGVFRYQTLNTSLRTTWLRDALEAYATWSIQTNATPGNLTTTQFIDPTTGQVISVGAPIAGTGQSTDVKTVNINWLHELSPDMTLNSGASYSYVRRSEGLGTDGALAASVALQYMLSASASLTGRYAFYDRVSKIPGYSLYENVLLVGFTKTF